MDFVNKIKTKDGTEYSINDLRIPAPTSADAGKALGVDASGNFAYVSAGGPSGPVVKGDKILIDGKAYRVLSTNADNTDVELVAADLVGASKFWDVSGSPTADQKVTFMVDGTETLGLKYDGSTLDTFCNETFYADLPSDVKDAIIEQEVVQDLYNTNAEEGTEDFLIDGGTFGMTYRIKKMNDASVTVGNRKCYSLSVADYIKYFGNTATNNQINDFTFGYGNSISIYSWLRDANSSFSYSGCRVYGSDGFINDSGWSGGYVVFPAFHVNLTSISYSK